MSSRPADQQNREEPSDRRPIDPTTGAPLPPRATPGYYPDFHAYDQRAFWDEATRRIVEERVEAPPPLRFFTKEEIPLMQAVLDRLIPQDDRDPAHRVPVLNYLDARLDAGKIDGYRYHDMPSDRDAYRLGLRGIEAVARQMYGASFVDLSPGDQDAVLWTLHEAKPQGGDEIWQQVPVDRFWILLMSDAVEAYYRHPYAWDEIGFGGPAYPRGYFRLEGGKPEPWEVREQRYEWAAPPPASSDRFQPLGGRHPHRSPAGQEGTH